MRSHTVIVSDTAFTVNSCTSVCLGYQRPTPVRFSNMATKKAAGGLPSSGAGSPPENRARQRPRAASGGLQPKVMGTALSLHGVVIIAALAIGAHEGGVAGALLAVPLTAVLWASFKTFRDMRDGVPGKLPAEDDEAAPAVQA
ncbi:AI-2E family transporter [Kocuria rhizophila]|nr:hypothetical protein CEP81_11970 [Kocuria rhizophila]